VTYRVCVLPGDGIGPDVTAAALHVLGVAADRYGFEVETEEHPFGGAGIDAAGDPLPPAVLAAARESDAVLKGPVGGPKWDGGAVRPEQGILRLRSELDVYANLRPTRQVTARVTSPLRPELAEGIDLIIVRELTAGLYFGEQGRDGDRAYDTCVYTEGEIRRIARRAFELARTRRGKVTHVDKANILETSRMWREVVNEVAREHPDVVLEHQLVDSMSMKLVEQPAAYDVVLTENLFGDILSDLAASVAGGIGLASSASLADGGPGLFEPVHGSAPDIAGTGQANPAAMILTVALLLDDLGQPAAARALETAVKDVLDAGTCTPDLGGQATTAQVGEAIAARVAASSPVPSETR
jgi:3-isopropylmalate dehydrogenase